MSRRVAILGAGIGAAHLAAYRALPARFSVVCLCDRDRARAEAVAGGTPVSTDIAAVLADPAIELVDICLPPDLHLEVALAALAAGKHVVCEKPLVTALAEADRLEAAAAAARRAVFPVFQYRFGIGMAQFQAVAAAGLTGAALVATVETHWNRDAAYYAVPWRGTWAGERGGAVLGHAIHAHDLLTATLGPVAEVGAVLATRVNPIEVEDCAAITFRMASGALATSSVTLGAARDMSRLRLVFERVTVESDHAPYAPAARPWRFTARLPEDEAALDAVLAAVPAAPAGFEGFFSAIADALEGRPSAAVTLADGRRSIELVTAIYASARAGGPVALPLATDHPLYGGWQPAAGAVNAG